IEHGGVNIQLLEDDNDDDMIIVVASDEQDLQELFRLVNNAFIQEEAEEHQFGRAVGIDYALVDFLGVQLKPQTYEISTVFDLHEDCAVLFTHDALRDRVKHLVYV
ncbi:hypothetical protein AAVH_40084, partial [Aphelenchoides avenae]